MKHTNKIAIEVLTNEFSDYPANEWHYTREYNLIVTALNKLPSPKKNDCPFCGKQMDGIHLTHYKCKNCNEYFTD